MREKFGVPPDKVVDVQALAGDSTDNVPGVPGIGVKTAAELINEYGDLETLLARAGEIKQPKRRERLTEFAVQARLSRDLVTLKDDVPVEVPVEQLGVREPEPDALLGFLREMEFCDADQAHRRGLGRRGAAAGRPAGGSAAEATRQRAGGSRRRAQAGGKRARAAARTTPQAAVVAAAQRGEGAEDRPLASTRPSRSCAQLEAWIAEARAAGRFAFDTETTSLDPMQAEFVGFSLAVAPGKACYVPLGHRAGSGSLRFRRRATSSRCRSREALAAAEAAAGGPLGPQDRAEPQVRLPGARAGTASTSRRSTTPCCCPTRSTAAAASTAWTRWPSATCGHTCMPFTQVLEHAPGAKKSDKTFAQVPLDKATEYAAEDADVTLRLWMVLKPRLAAERMATVYETLERPLVPVLADMERAGIKVDSGDPVAAHLDLRAAHRPARGGDLRAGRAQVQPRLAQAARRVPVRQPEAARRPQDQDRPVGDARRPARRSRRPRGPARGARASSSTSCWSGGS